MELYQIRTFLVVAQEQSLTRAAERLAISQPAVSGQIKNLERELDVNLFDRIHSGMQVSAAGRALVESAQALLGAATTLRAQASALSGQPMGQLALGVVLHPDATRLGILVQRLRSIYPLVRLDIRHRNTLTVVHSLRSYELDASFYIGRDLPADMGYVDLRQLVYKIAAAPQWQSQLATVGWPQIARLPWIRTPVGGAFAQLVDALFRPRGLELANVIEADQEQAIISLVQAGVGISLIREQVALQGARAGNFVLWNDESMEATLRLLYLKSRESEPMLRALIELAVAVSSEPGEDEA